MEGYQCQTCKVIWPAAYCHYCKTYVTQGEAYAQPPDPFAWIPSNWKIINVILDDGGEIEHRRPEKPGHKHLDLADSRVVITDDGGSTDLFMNSGGTMGYDCSKGAEVKVPEAVQGAIDEHLRKEDRGNQP